MRVHVAFVPDEAAAAPTGIVVDVLRATSTIAQAMAVRIDGFDAGASPREFPRAEGRDAHSLHDERDASS